MLLSCVFNFLNFFFGGGGGKKGKKLCNPKALKMFSIKQVMFVQMRTDGPTVR